MKLWRLHVGGDPEREPEPGDAHGAAHGGDFASADEASDAAADFAGQRVVVEPIEWNEDASDPRYENAGAIKAPK